MILEWPSPSQKEAINRARVAHLATADAAADPHVIPVCFVYDGLSVYSVVDQKPKRVEAMELRRVRNILMNPQVALVVDQYNEDWTALGYTLIKGRAEILSNGAEILVAIRLLREKYTQYQTMDIDDSPVIKIHPSRIIGWGRPGQ